MLKEGMFIQERYEVIGRIGSGGMADVYKAKDHKLNRFVAVKVLKQEFREDKVFISKFRAEAQSAAGLAHPNIVNVYDVGEDHGISYIVMELVEGISLKEYIDKKGRLAVREATSIAMQVCMGLEAAHRNGIVHRDVKPQNIIISTDGKVKVTDFGIARAASSNTINSSVMGSVHYSSPEQARGGYSDYKSDIYSMGISMYEMLTGTVPFDGDSTVAIAIKHLQEEIPSPRKYVPDLPKSTVDIILKCTQKSPDRRYNDMAELIRDLKESLVNPEGDFVQLSQVNNNARTVVISNEELNQIKQSHGESSVSKQPVNNQGGYQRYEEPKAAPIYNGYPPQGGYVQGNPQNPGSIPGTGPMPGYQPRTPYQEPYFDDDEDDEESLSPKLEKVMTIGSIIIGLIILCIFLALAGNATGLLDFEAIKDSLMGGKKPVQTEALIDETETGTGTEKVSEAATEADTSKAEVPDLFNLTEEEAIKELNSRSIGGVKSGEQPSADVEAGKILSQSPKSGTEVERNTTVYYVVSSGAADVEIPALSGKPLLEVQEACDKVGIKYKVNYTPNDTVLAEHVIYSDPPEGTTVQTGTEITLWVSKPKEGAEPQGGILKDYTGENIIAAQTGLEAAGMIVTFKEEDSEEHPAGTIISQDISGENVEKGTNITLVVSTGKKASETEAPKETAASSETAVGDDVIVIGETESKEGTYSCFVNLTAPEEYSGQPVKLVITQDGKSTTLVDGEVIQFPYKLRFSSDSASEGLVTLSLLNEDGSVGNEFEYQHVPFK